MDNTDNASLTHPLSIFFSIYRYLYLLLIPLARGIVSIISGDFLGWLSGAWFDLLIIALIFILAFQRWRHLKYLIDDSGIYYTFGIFYQHQIYIPMRRICTLCALQPFWLRPFKMVRIRVDSLALDEGKADFEFYVWKSEAQRIMALRKEPPTSKNGTKASYKPRLLDMVCLSLFTSNSLIGVVLIATFLAEAGKLLGQGMTEILITAIDELAHRLAIGFSPILALLPLVFQIPPIAALIALILLTGWLIAFTLNLLQTKNLQIERTSDSLHITGGILVSKEYAIRVKDISFIDIRQSLLTRAFRLYSVFLHAIGFGKEKDIAAIIPFSKKENCNKYLSLLLPEFTSCARTLKPNAGAIMKFLIDPLWPCFLIPLLTTATIYIFPAWTSLLRFMGLILSLPAFWFLGVRLMDYFSSGVSRIGDFFTLRYSQSFYLHTVVFAYDKIVLINVRQSILQRGDHKCDLVVSTMAESRRKHHIRNLGWDDTVELFEAQDLKKQDL